MDGKDTLIPAVHSFNEESVLRFTAYTQIILIYYMKNICTAKLGCMRALFRDNRMKYAITRIFFCIYHKKYPLKMIDRMLLPVLTTEHFNNVGESFMTLLHYFRKNDTNFQAMPM